MMSYEQLSIKMGSAQTKGVIEGLLFVSGDEGIDLKQLTHILQLDRKEVIDILEEMKLEFKRQKRGIQIIEMADSYQLTTLPEHAPFFEKLAQSPSHSTLSQAALETLAIIAYKQPITRIEVDEVRGVRGDRALRTLVNRSLIKEVGRKEGVGRPILYGTTNEFLDYFGLRDISNLPPLSNEASVEDVQQEADLLFSRDQGVSEEQVGDEINDDDNK